MTVTAQSLADNVSPAGVHSHIPQRPVFTDSGSPSNKDVASLALATARMVVGAVSEGVPDALADYATSIVELGTAAKVEQSWWPEQQVGNTATAEMLWAEYNDALTRLVAQSLSDNQTGSSRGFGQISLHKRTTKLWQRQELAADGLRPAITEAGVVAAVEAEAFIGDGSNLAGVIDAGDPDA